MKAAERLVVSMMFRRLLGSTVVMLGFVCAGEVADINTKTRWAFHHVGHYFGTLTGAADPTLLNVIYKVANCAKRNGSFRFSLEPRILYRSRGARAS